MTHTKLLERLLIACLLIIGNGTLLVAQPTLYKQVDKTKMNHWVDSIFNKMTADERIGQLFIYTVDPAPASRAAVLAHIKGQKIGGLLFSKGSVKDQAESINQYQKASTVPLFITSDAEWGLSMRLANTPLFPRNMMLGAIQDNDLIRLYGEEMGRECQEMGIQINFSPDLDVNVNPANPVIGNRSFGENPQDVAEKGLAYAKGLESKHVISVAKHFPGHGDTNTDSHAALPVINHDRKHLDDTELYPFKQYIAGGYSGVMVGHLSIPALDETSGLPASLSPKIIRELLKDELGFEGIVLTDALEMKGAGRAGSACVEALAAGNDLLLGHTKVAEEIAAIKKALKDSTLNQSDLDAKCLKILRYKYITGLNRLKPIDLKGLSKRLNSTYADWLIQKLNEEAITLLKNNDEAIPLNQLAKRKIAVVSFGESGRTDFQNTMALYDKFDFLQFPTGTENAAVSAKLKNYDVVVAAIHSAKSDYVSAALEALTQAKKEVHLCFFISPYTLPKYKQSIVNAQSVTLAYENTPHAQKAAAEVIMGGLPAKGKLPVSINGLYDYHDGLTTEKTRLSYQYPMEVNMSQRKLDAIADIVKEGLDKKAFPGCQVLIAKNGVVIYNQSFGYFDYAQTHPVETTDIYDLASVTKATATLAAVIKLVDTGKLGLQDKLSKHVPGIRGSNKAGITVREALFHQSGLPAFYPFYQTLIDPESYSGSLFSDKRDLVHRVHYDNKTYARTDYQFFPHLVSKTPQKGIRKQAAADFYVADDMNERVVAAIATDVKLRKNKNYRYSDLNFILLKEAVENITGQPLDKYTEENIFANLGAATTGFLPLKKFDRLTIAPTENDEFWRNQLLIGYPSDETAAILGGVSGNAGLFSNANDLAKLLQLYLNSGTYGGERYFSEKTTRLFTNSKSPSSRRGLGFDKPDKAARTPSKVVSKLSPAGVYGHVGYTGTCFWVDPDNQLIYIFLTNRIYPSRINSKLSELNIRARMQDAIYEALR
ncbi:beta-N-acetylglucosaminidase [Bacteroidia bacterium]|nr:beta-N-acetylglucosaminidase [Bacteroidia bacterium]